MDRGGHPPELDDQRSSPADRERELRLTRGAADDGHLVPATSTPRARSGTASTPVARTSTPSRRSPRSTPRAVRAPTPTPSRTRASTPTWSPTGRSSPTGSRPRRWRSSERQERQRSLRGPRETLRNELGNQRLLGMSLDAGGTPHPRLPPEHLRQDVPPAAVRHRPRDRAARLRRRRRQAREFKPLVLVAGYSAYPRRVDFAKMREIADEVGATLMVDMAHFAGPGRRQGVHRRRGPGAPRPRRHHHHLGKSLRGLRRPRPGAGLRPEVDRGCPMVLGGPLSHVMAAKAVALAEARQPEFPACAPSGWPTTPSRSRTASRPAPNWSPDGTDNHLVAARRDRATGRVRPSDAGVVTNPQLGPAGPGTPGTPPGIRLGTPALTTRGFGHDEFDAWPSFVHVLQNAARHHQAGGPSVVHPRRGAWPTRSATPRPRWTSTCNPASTCPRSTRPKVASSRSG